MLKTRYYNHLPLNFMTATEQAKSRVITSTDHLDKYFSFIFIDDEPDWVGFVGRLALEPLPLLATSPSKFSATSETLLVDGPAEADVPGWSTEGRCPWLFEPVSPKTYGGGGGRSERLAPAIAERAASTVRLFVAASTVRLFAAAVAAKTAAALASRMAAAAATARCPSAVRRLTRVRKLWNSVSNL